MARQLALNIPGAGARPSRNQLLDADRPVHDWYRFVLSFPPHLVRDYLAEFRAGPDSVVLDPFCGTGTTPVEAKKLGIKSIGIEALPLSAFAARTKLDWSADPDELHRAADTAARLAADAESGPLRTLPEAQMHLLPDRAISPLPLHKALCLRDAIAEAPEHLHGHLLLALAKNLPTRIGNLRFGPEIGLGAIREDADVIGEWRAAVAEFADDLELAGSGAATQANVIHGDAREAGELLEPGSIDAVITSPRTPTKRTTPAPFASNQSSSASPRPAPPSAKPSKPSSAPTPVASTKRMMRTLGSPITPASSPWPTRSNSAASP